MTWAARGRRHTESFPLSFLFRVADTITNHRHGLFPRTNSIIAVCFWLGRRNPSQVFVNLSGSESRKRLNLKGTICVKLSFHVSRILET